MFNKKIAKAVALAVVTVLIALGVANTDKIAALLDAAVAFAPDESAAPVGDVPASADAGL